MSADSILLSLPDYPEADDVSFSFDWARKKELMGLKLGPSEDIPDEAGVPLNSQLMQERFFTPQSDTIGMLLGHDPGTGKCVMPDTLINTTAGKVPISELWRIYAGTMVKEPTGGMWAAPLDRIEVYTALSTFKHTFPTPVHTLFRQRVNEVVVRVGLENGKVLECTTAHKLGTISEDGSDEINWTNVYDIGTIVVTMDSHQRLGTSAIRSLNFRSYTGYVYDLEIEGTHSYSANNIMCHNTCTTATIIENFKTVLKRDGLGKEPPALVIIPNRSLIKNYSTMVAYQCTKDVYFAKPGTMKAVGITLKESIESRWTKIYNAVKSTYEFATYRKFLGDMPPSKELKRKYSNRIIYIDEIHNIRQNVVSAKKDAGLVYKNLHYFLHTVENCRIILGSATLIWDQPYEIAGHINLLLPLDKQLPTGTAFNARYFDSKGELKHGKELEAAFRGRVSILRSMITTAKREEIGVTKPWTEHIKIYPSALSDFQSKYARKAMKKSNTSKSDALLSDARDADVFVFPIFNKKGDIVGGEYGKIGQKNNIQIKNKRFVYRDPRVKKLIATDLGKVSSIFAAIIHEAKTHPNEVIFVAVPFVVFGGSGLVNLAMTFEANGFQRRYSSADMKTSKSGERAFISIADDGIRKFGSGAISSILQKISSKENRYGDLCQVILGSKKIAEGYTIGNVRQVHIPMSHWNTSLTDQFIGRAYRVGSHKHLPKEERYVKIYRHAPLHRAPEQGNAVPGSKGKGYPATASFTKEITTTVSIYRKAEAKEMRAAHIYRLMKKMAWDCPLAYGRNVLKTDVDGTKECDYTECNYMCNGYPEELIDKSGQIWDYTIPPEVVDRNTYDLFYSEDVIVELIVQLSDLFGFYSSLSLNNIVELLSLDSNDETLLMASLDKMISYRLPIKDRFGFIRFLREDGNMYFLVDTIGVPERYQDAVYVSTPLITEITPLEDLITIYRDSVDKTLVKKLCKTPTDLIFNDLSFDTKVGLFEYAVKLKQLERKGAKTDVVKYILRIMSPHLLTFDDGTVGHLLIGTRMKRLTLKVLRGKDQLRIFNSDTEEWEIASPELQKKYLDPLIKGKMKKDDFWDDKPEGLYGFRDNNNKFKIREKPPPGKPKRMGSVCYEASWSLERLYALFKRLDVYLDVPKDIKGMSKDELRFAIKANNDFSAFHVDVDSLSTKKLQQIFSLGKYQKKRLCDFIESTLKERGLYGAAK
jgi:hypothetical protein